MDKTYKPNLQNWPVYFKDTLRVGSLASNVAIATLWTPLDLICQGLKKNLYAVAGQLYSRAGTNFILRNVLANPLIRYIVICGKEHPREKSGRALFNLVKKGIDENHQIIGIENAFIDREIPEAVVNQFRKGIKIIDMRGVLDSAEIAKRIQGLPALKPFAKPFLYPTASSKEGNFPHDRTPQKIKAKTVVEVWPEILRYVMRFGNDEMTNYGTLAREVPNLIAVITQEDPFNPKLASFLNIDTEDIRFYIEKDIASPELAREQYYSYGERLRTMPPNSINQVDIIVKKLKKDFNDRGAIAVLWDVEKDNRILRNPCLVLIQGKIIRENFDLTGYFRSNDVFGAWPLDAFGLRALQHEIAKRINKKVGILTTISSCAHIYQEKWKEAEEIIKKYGKKMFCEWDPRGNFIISVEGKEIVANFYSPRGRFLQEFRQEGVVEKAAIAMYQKLLAANTISSLSHAFDLGAELQKAEIAVKHNLKYTQDQPLKF